ncbi:MAG: hypothetical protein ABR529_05265 [Actinomycetota bacterium]
MVMVDRRALNVVVAVLGIEQRELAERMGYRPGYVANVLNGCTPASDAFRWALGEALAELLLGSSRKAASGFPAQPLSELIERRAAGAASRRQFYADLELSCHGWNKRQELSADLIDRVCCALGVHPSSLYPDFCLEEAS